MQRTIVPWLVTLGVATACARVDRNIGSYQPSAAPSATDAGAPTLASGGRNGDGGAGSEPRGEAGESATAGSAGSPDACVVQFTGYGDYRSQVVAEFASFSCMVDSDCLAFYDQSACDPSCVLNVTAAGRGVVDRLNNFETSNCATECWPQPWTVCPAPTPAICVSGRCE